MSAVIVSRCLQPPAYDDTHLGNESLWIFENSALLARYWQQLGRALGIDDRDGEEDLDCWLKSQHNIRCLIMGARGAAS